MAAPKGTIPPNADSGRPRAKESNARSEARSERNSRRNPSAILAALVRRSANQPEPEPPKPDTTPSNLLRLELDRGETPDGMRAKTVIRPTLRSAMTIAALDKCVGEIDLTSLVEKLKDQVSAVQGGDMGRSEEMLITQAHTLDMLFHQLVYRSARNGDAGYLGAAETYMRLALRTQSQCRATLETLSVVKNPPSVAFVRQANIAHGPQQVNNAPRAGAEASRARESQNRPNELLEQHHNGSSTGPRTAEGKAEVARNAYRGGVRSLLRSLARVMRQQREELEVHSSPAGEREPRADRPRPPDPKRRGLHRHRFHCSAAHSRSPMQYPPYFGRTDP